MLQIVLYYLPSHVTFKLASHSIVRLSHEQFNGIIERWFHCLMSDSKGRFLSNKCVQLAITCHLYFLRISKVSSMSHHGSVGQVHSKECHFIFTYTFMELFLLFFTKNIVFIIVFYYYYYYYYYFALV